ncbi:MAG: VWA domain-containing protein [Candidatus Sumerlaeia bacterium]
MGIPGFISLAYPELLLLGLVLVWLYVRRLRHKNLWRTMLLILGILLLAYPSFVRSSKALNLCLLVDLSRSMSDEARAKQLEIMEYIKDNMEAGDRVSVVSFSDQPHVEQGPQSTLSTDSFDNPYSEDATDLAEAIETAVGLVGRAPNSRIFLMSDGEYTGRNPIGEAREARQNEIGIYYRDLKRLEVFNLSVTDVRMPEKILVNEPFRIVFRVFSSTETPGRYRLYRNDRIVGMEDNQGWRDYNFKQGENLITFSDATSQAGIQGYRLEVESIPADREILKKDNLAERFVQVLGERPVLLVNNTGQADNVANILSAGNIPLHIASIDNFHLDIRQLEGYKALILNNVPILSLSRKQIEDIKHFVTQEGGGLLVCGGNRSFASGGYYKTAIDEILPVSLEDRQQSKKTATAFSIVLDRSGSMAMTTPSGETKMSLANNASAECVRLMSSVDSVSVIAVDSMAHIMVQQTPVEFPESIVSDVLSIESMGGGIFVYTGLVAASREILGAKQLNKHILLFADAADAEEPGDYKRLLGDLTRAGVTVSVVGLGTEQDRDAEFLKDIAKRGNGSAYFTQDAAQLVQFFTADTITYTRKRFIEETAAINVNAAAYTMMPQHNWQDFACADYNLLFSKPDANVALVTADEDAAPTLAFWQRGLGRVSALAFDPSLTFADTAQYGDIMLGTVRWIMGSSVFDNLQIDVNYEGSYVKVHMEIAEEERETVGTPEIIVFKPNGDTLYKTMHWSSHDRLTAQYKIDESGLHRGVIRIAGKDFKIGPMSMPISPEFMPNQDPEYGRKTMRELARITRGKRVQDIGSQLFDRTERAQISRPVHTPFLIAFLIFLLLDIAEARFSMLVWMRRRWNTLTERFRLPTPESPKARSYDSPESGTERKGSGRRARFAEKGEAFEKEKSSAEKPKEAAKAEAPKDDMDYLKESKSKAQRKIGK